MKRWQKVLIIFLIVAVAAGLGFLNKLGLIWSPKSFLKPVPAPRIDEKIKGYWSSEGPMAFAELNDAEEMKSIGINTVTFSPILSHDQEGRVKESPGSERYVKRTINKAHQAGIRVMLETTPMNAGAVDPKVTNPELFQDEMTEIALKYARLAEEYGVEYFAPIVEPVHHMSAEEADRWLQELGPKLKQVYRGPIMWKKQASDLEQSQEWKEDHIFKMRFKLDDPEIMVYLKSVREHKINLSISREKVQLDEYSQAGSQFSEFKENPLSTGWHDLGVEIRGNLITVEIDGRKLIEKTDDSGPIGGYALSGAMRISKLEITDLKGQTLYQEKFENLNSFSTKSLNEGLKLEGKEIVISTKNEVKLIHDINFSGYDYIAIDTYHRGRVVTIDEYIDYLKYYIQKTKDQAKADGVGQIILAEFGGSTRANIGWNDADERAKIPLTEEEVAQVTRRVLEVAENKVDGYIYNGWNIKGQGINQIPAVKEVIKEWYLSH